jgi:hypothetical protein
MDDILHFQPEKGELFLSGVIRSHLAAAAAQLLLPLPHRRAQRETPSLLHLPALLALGQVAFLGVEDALAQPDRLRRDLDQFVLPDELKSLLRVMGRMGVRVTASSLPAARMFESFFVLHGFTLRSFSCCARR